MENRPTKHYMTLCLKLVEKLCKAATPLRGVYMMINYIFLIRRNKLWKKIKMLQ